MNNNGYLRNRIRKASAIGVMIYLLIFIVFTFGITVWIFSQFKRIVFSVAYVISIILFICIVKHFFILVNPKLCKTYRFLSKTSDNIERELENMDLEMSSPQTKTLSKFTISKSWIIFRTLLHTYVYRMDSIIWVYVDQISEYYNGLPSGTTYKVHLSGKEEQDILKTGDANEAAGCLEAVRYFKPYAVFGYSSEANDMYLNNRAEMIRQVEQNKNHSND